jgi:hypothetical protein
MSPLGLTELVGATVREYLTFAVAGQDYGIDIWPCAKSAGGHRKIRCRIALPRFEA